MWTDSSTLTLNRNDAVAGAARVRQTRVAAAIPYICPSRSHSLKSTCNPNQPIVLPLLGRNDSVAFRPIGGRTARSPALGVLTPWRTHSPNGTAVERQSNDSPSPGWERFNCQTRKAETNSAGGCDSAEQPTAEAVTKWYLQSEPVDGPPSPWGCGRSLGEKTDPILVGVRANFPSNCIVPVGEGWGEGERSFNCIVAASS